MRRGRARRARGQGPPSRRPRLRKREAGRLEEGTGWCKRLDVDYGPARPPHILREVSQRVDLPPLVNERRNVQRQMMPGLLDRLPRLRQARPAPLQLPGHLELQLARLQPPLAIFPAPILRRAFHRCDEWRVRCASLEPRPKPGPLSLCPLLCAEQPLPLHICTFQEHSRELVRVIKARAALPQGVAVHGGVGQEEHLLDLGRHGLKILCALRRPPVARC
mmetsp:Transcript_16280/g.51160  ORF Transcript_16280/g.51160 Transcript_16280/m.51160 type:complete len:220 (-) Transcript_16280:359-1018(-)